MPSLPRLMDSHLRSALIGATTSLTIKVAAAAAGVGLTVLIARRFGAAGSGTWVLANTILMIASVVVLSGLDYGTTRAVAIYKATERWPAIRAWTWTAILILGAAAGPVSLLVWFGAPWLARSLGETEHFVHVTRILGLAVAPAATLRLVAGLLRGMRRFAFADLLESGLTPGLLASAILLLGVQTLDYAAGLFVAIAAAGAIGGMLAWFALMGDRGKPRDRLMPLEALGRSLPMAGTVLATLATPWVMTLFLAKYATTAEVGIFRVALQFALLLGFLLNAAETGLSPQIAALHSQGKLKELSNSARQITLLIIVLGGGASLALLFFTRSFLSILGPEFEQGANAMRILIAAQMFNLATGPVGSFMVMTGLERFSFWNALAGGTTVLVLSALLVPHLGIEGAAIAGGSSTILRNFVATVVVWRKHGLFLPLGIIRGSSTSGSAR